MIIPRPDTGYASRAVARDEKKFNANYPPFGNAPLKMSFSPVLSEKLLINIGLNGRKIYGLPGTPALKFTRL